MKFGLLFLTDLANCVGTKLFCQLISLATLGTHRLKVFKSNSVTHKVMYDPCFHKEAGWKQTWTGTFLCGHQNGDWLYPPFGKEIWWRLQNSQLLYHCGLPVTTCSTHWNHPIQLNILERGTCGCTVCVPFWSSGWYWHGSLLIATLVKPKTAMALFSALAVKYWEIPQSLTKGMESPGEPAVMRGTCLKEWWVELGHHANSVCCFCWPWLKFFLLVTGW